MQIICATNRDLEALIAQGRFRSDLYYRLKGVMLEMPALRERLEDVPVLTQHFLEKVARQRNEPVRHLSDEALALLARHRWPGNIRELENVIASASIFAEGSEIGLEAFSHVAELLALMQQSRSTLAPVGTPTPAPPFAPSPGSAPPVLEMGEAVDYYQFARRRELSPKELRREVET